MKDEDKDEDDLLHLVRLEVGYFSRGIPLLRRERESVCLERSVGVLRAGFVMWGVC